MTGSSRKVGRATKGLGEAPKSCTRKEHESATNSIAKRGQGAIAPCRVKGQRPLGVWGNAPTVPRPTNPKEVANKGAGSEASLPVSLRVRRRALKLLFPQDSVKNQMTAIPRHSRQQENGQFLRHAGEYSTIFKHRQLCANANAPASLSADERVLFLYYFQIRGAGFRARRESHCPAAGVGSGSGVRSSAATSGVGVADSSSAYSRFSVLTSAVPVADSPFAFWNAFTAFCVPPGTCQSTCPNSTPNPSASAASSTHPRRSCSLSASGRAAAASPRRGNPARRSAAA